MSFQEWIFEGPIGWYWNGNELQYGPYLREGCYIPVDNKCADCLWTWQGKPQYLGKSNGTLFIWLRAENEPRKYFVFHTHCKREKA